MKLVLASAVAAVLLGAATAARHRPRPVWKLLSSARGDLPVPGESQQQTGALVADLDRDGRNDFVLSFRQRPPALVWYRRTDSGWARTVIETELLALEAGGAAHDIDGDGDLDLVWGSDSTGNALWWWENPAPHFDPAVSWRRRFIKNSGQNQHHDQLFADLLGAGKPQLVFWNQKAKTIFLADVPPDPRTAGPWTLTPIFTRDDNNEGLDAADIDGDGRTDLLAGSSWFKHTGARHFRPTRIADSGGRIAAGQLVAGGRPEVVIGPGDGTGPLRWYECAGDPADSRAWSGHALIPRDLVHGHSLALGDVDRDGNLDVVAAEMAKWSEGPTPADNPAATAFIFYGDGRGHFETVELVRGHGFHELRLADLDGDGDLDVLNKPYAWQAPRVDVWINGAVGYHRRR